MSLTNARDLLTDAQARGCGVGAFNVIGLEHAQAIMDAAEREQVPAILQLSQNAVTYNGGRVGPIGHACRVLAMDAAVPIALHLDHATTWELCAEALDVGFGSVMFDASHLPLAENVAMTREIAARVQAQGAMIEAELGTVGGKDGVESTDALNTDPDEARWYVASTGVDSLAVAIGTSHGMPDGTARIDLDRLSRIRRMVDVPLVLHGGSGVADDDVRAAIRAGIVKVNTATQLNRAFTAAVRESLASDPAVVDPRVYLGLARAAMVHIVRQRLRLMTPGAPAVG